MSIPLRSLRRMRGLAAVFALLAAVAIGACSGSEGESTTTSAAPSTTTEQTPTTTTPRSVPGVDFDTRTITIGVLADLTGPFAGIAADAVDAHLTYWRGVNAEGGIDGWTVDVDVRDTRNDVARHQAAYEEIRDSVLALSLSTGSTTNAEALDDYVADSMLVIPQSWFSGWPFPGIDGGAILEQNTNYCLEAMNMVDFTVQNGGQSVSFVTLDDAYGRDAGAGMSWAADQHGLDVRFDGTAAVVLGGELSPVIRGIVDGAADWTLLATNPSLGAEIIAGAVRSGYEGMFIGAGPSYDSRLLDSASAELYDARFFQSAYVVAWGQDVPGNVEMMSALAEAYPDRRPSDTFIVGWNTGVTMREVLATAIARGALTREGVLRAANAIDEIDFGGAAPAQGYVGAPDEFVTRESAIYKPDLATYLDAGGANQTLSQADASTGSVLVRGFTAGEAATAYRFTSPCHVPGTEG